MERGLILLSGICKLVEFKGTKDGIVLQIKKANKFEDVITCVREKLEKSTNFFTGANIIGVEGDLINETNRYSLYSVLKLEFNLNVVSLDRIVKVEKKQEVVIKAPVEHKLNTEEECKINYNEYDTKIVKMTLRSGMSISYDGNIVVIGDVNPGAEVIAAGNVIVVGKLRGMVHAGKFGNKQTYIVAEKLLPTQLRIANIIARSPENVDMSALKKELASIKSGRMNIEEV